MTRRPAAVLAVLAVLAPAAAAAQPTTLVYLDGANAPAPLVRKVDERLRAMLAERGILIVEPPAVGAAAASDARIADARKSLDAGVAAWKALSLDAAQSSLAAAESAALAAPEAPAAAQILAEARLHLGLCELTLGRAVESDRLFRKVAIADPDRRLDVRSFPPDVIGAYEKSRKAIAAAAPCELTVSADPAPAALYIDGRTLGAPVVKLPCGEHLVAAAAEGGIAGERIDLAEPTTSLALRVAPDPARLAVAARAAAKKGDEPALTRALDALIAATGAERVLAWDLRSTAGRVESPMRLRDPVSRNAMRSTTADLATTAAPDPALRAAITSLLTGVPQDGSAEAVPVARNPPRASRKGLAGWVWWTAGGVAILAAGGAAAALAQPSNGGSDDSISVTVDK